MGAHGVHGDLKVKMHNPESELLLSIGEVILTQGDEERRVRVLESREHGPGLIMRLAGVRDREGARALYGAQLCVTRDDLPEPDDDEFYLVDAIGARVVLTDGREVGVVESFRSYPTCDVFCIRSEDGLRELPVLDPYFVAAELSEGRIVVDRFQDLELEPERKKR